MRRLTSLADRFASSQSALLTLDPVSSPSLVVAGPKASPSQNSRRITLGLRAASLAILITALASLVVTGCTTEGSAVQNADFDPDNPGTVMGGLQPVTNSALQLYAVDLSGGNASIRPLLREAVHTNSVGNFSVYGKFTCPDAASQIFLVATGGNPGYAGETDNRNITLLSALGPCGDITPKTPIVINEVTTVASAGALASFLKVADGANVQATQAELEAAFQLATNFANAATGTAPGTNIPAGYTVPASTINTLANLLSTCVYSTGGRAGDETPCGKLFTYATEPGAAAPTNTLYAVLNILSNPTHNVDQLYSLVEQSSASKSAEAHPFSPELTSAPANWSINLIGEASTPHISSITAPGEVTVSLSDAFPAAALYYTLDGTTPSASSDRYKGPFTIAKSATVKSIAVVGKDVSSIASETFSVGPAATRLVFVTEPQSTLTTSTFSVSLALEDADGNIVPTANQPVTVSLGADPTGTSLEGTLTETPASGKATFDSLSIGTPGERYTVTAKAAGLPAVTSLAFDISLPYPDLHATQAHTAASFLSSVGINTHFNYYGSIYTNNTPLMIQSLQALGITHLRDAMCWQGPEHYNTYYALHQKLAGLGFKVDFIASYNQPASQIAAYPALVTDAEAVEPANEYDISGDPNWAADITAQQKLLYTTIHSSTDSNSITVLAPSLAYPTDEAALGNVSGIATAGNLHGYFGGNNPGSTSTNPSSLLKQIAVVSPSQPVWVTETGYFAQPGPFAGSYGVDLATQAVYLPRTLLEYFNAGAGRTYIYQLADDLEPGQDPANYHWGLLDSNGNRKPAFTALANLMTTLADSGNSFTPSTLAFKLAGANSNVRETLFQKSDGTFYLAVWIEAPSYNFLTQKDLNVPTQKVNLQLNNAVVSAQSIQWDATGAATTTSLAPSQSIPLTLSDKIQMIKLQLK